MNSTNTKLVIVAGAAGEIGTAFLKQLSGNGIDCIAIIRNKSIQIKSPLIRSIRCNLEDSKDIENTFKKIEISSYSQIIYLHTIGVDKFSPRGYPTIKPMDTLDADVYNSNVNTFKHLMRYLVNKVNDLNNEGNQTKLKISMIAGVADKYSPFVIESFCEAKYILRQYIQSSVNLFPESISGLSINITSTITKSALQIRPFANTEYWLSPAEVSLKSLDDLLEEKDGYKEIDIIKASPDFVPEYYIDNQMLYEKWSEDTGIK